MSGATYEPSQPPRRPWLSREVRVSVRDALLCVAIGALVAVYFVV